VAHRFPKQSDVARSMLAAFAVWSVSSPHAQSLIINSGTTSLTDQSLDQLIVSDDGTIVNATGMTVNERIFVTDGASLDIKNSVICTGAQCDVGLRVQGLGVHPGESGIRTHVSGSGLEIYGSATGIAQYNSSLVELNDVHINARGIGIDLNGGLRKDNEPVVTKIRDFSIVARRYGVYAMFGAEAHLADGTIATTDDAGHGVYLGGATAGAAPIQTTAYMDGVTVSTNGERAYGLYSEQVGGTGSYLPRGAVSYWTNSSLTTAGAGSHGVVANFGWNAVTLADGSTVSTHGPDAHAVLSKGGAEVVLDGARAFTTGNGSVGVVSDLHGISRLHNGTFVSTTGTGAHGAMVQRAGRLEMAGSAIRAEGVNAHGIYAFENASTGQQYGSEVTLTRSSVESKHGYGIVAQGGHLTASVLDGSVLTGGAGLMDVQDHSDPSQGQTVVDLLADGNSIIAGQVHTAGGAVSNMVLQGGATWRVDGDSQVTTLNNRQAMVQFMPAPLTPNGFSTLRVSKDYAGDGGTIVFNAALADDNSQSDRLVVGGDVSGQTYVKVVNRGGMGAATQEGIRIIDVEGHSPADAFALQHDYVAALGRPAIVAGAYGYSLYQGSTLDPHDGNWYLRSEYIDGGQGGGGEDPMYQPGAPLYESYGKVLHELNALSSLRERVGERQATVAAEPGGGAPQAQGRPAVWGRVQGSHGRFRPARSTTGAHQDVDIWRMQIGADMQAYENEHGQIVTGLNAHYGNASSRVGSVFGKGKIDARGYGLGGTLTWYGRNGFYVDAQAQASWFDSDLTSRTLGLEEVGGNDGFGHAFGVEAGRSFALNDHWGVTPQAQLTYSHVDYDEFRDAYQTPVSFQGRHRVVGRLGLSADYRRRLANGDALNAYGIVNLYQNFADTTRVSVADVSLMQRNQHTWAGVGAGASYNWGRGTYMLYGEADVRASMQNPGDSYGFMGTVGTRIRF